MKIQNDTKNAVQTSDKSEAKAAQSDFQVKEPARQGLVVSEFDRAPLTDVNFGF